MPPPIGARQLVTRGDANSTKTFTAERIVAEPMKRGPKFFSDDLLNGTSVEPKNVVSAFTVP
jgi:hypothetical protein